MKWVFYLVLLVLAAFSWKLFVDKGNELEKAREEILKVEDAGDPDEVLKVLEDKAHSLEADRTLSGIMLTFITAGIAGIIVVLYLVPFLAQQATHAVYDSAEMVDKDVMHDARSLLAQGDYQGAIEAFKKAAEEEPMNRLPWVEIAKVYKDHLDDPHSAINTIRNALEGQEWEVNDAAFFLFRLAEMYDEVMEDRASARAIMEQVVGQFEGTRHSANAKHKLHEWDVQEGAVAAGEVAPEAPKAPETQEDLAEQRRREEEEYLAKMRKQQGGGQG
ncbi:MAG: tetratricopeptide repeat protein [Verrucomicrobiota bacterium JB025]|nr:hypothetical protein [Verrucomicrobiota bacterium JB025]